MHPGGLAGLVLDVADLPAAEPFLHGVLHALGYSRIYRDGETVLWAREGAQVMARQVASPAEAVRGVRVQLRRAGDAIAGRWNAAYLALGDVVLPCRFADEARASLPGLSGMEAFPAPDDVLTALGLQRLRLRQDQGVPEWP